MAANLIEVANSLFTPDVVSKISSLIGETKTGQALERVMPSLAGIACNEASTPGGASKLYSLISSTRFPDDLHTNLAGLLSGGAATDSVLKTGSQLISSVFGDRAGTVANLIADSAGIRYSLASTLLNLAALLFVSMLSRRRSGNVWFC